MFQHPRFLHVAAWLNILCVACTTLAPRAAAESRLTNVSVRSAAGTGSETLIVGFTIAGSGNKQILVRGIGPGLVPYGVTNALSDPQLQLFGSTTTPLASNDDWDGSAAMAAAFSSVGAFALPVGSRDAALYLPLSPGGYTAQVSTTGGSGVALVEAYDADGAGASAQLNNVSARSLAGTGSSVLTVGFAITGSTPKTILIRAVGPSLSTYGVTGVLANPELTLFSSRSAVLGTNDGWLVAAGWAQAFSSVGAFPLPAGSTDSALLVNLQPGTYTAQASGVGNTTGVALIEVYDVAAVPAASLVLRPVENARPDSFKGTPVPPGRTRIVPVAISRAAPSYPFDLRRAGVTGEAVIDFIVGPDGTVTDAMIIRATDDRLGQSALTAVRKWLFQPGTIDGQAVSVLMEVPIVFILTG